MNIQPFMKLCSQFLLIIHLSPTLSSPRKGPNSFTSGNAQFCLKITKWPTYLCVLKVIKLDVQLALDYFVDLVAAYAVIHICTCHACISLATRMIFNLCCRNLLDTWSCYLKEKLMQELLLHRSFVSCSLL